MQVEVFALAALVLAVVLPASPAAAAEVKYFNVPQGDHPHDVAPAPDGRFGTRASAPACSAASIQIPDRSIAFR